MWTIGTCPTTFGCLADKSSMYGIMAWEIGQAIYERHLHNKESAGFVPWGGNVMTYESMDRISIRTSDGSPQPKYEKIYHLNYIAEIRRWIENYWNYYLDPDTDPTVRLSESYTWDTWTESIFGYSDWEISSANLSSGRLPLRGREYEEVRMLIEELQWGPRLTGGDHHSRSDWVFGLERDGYTCGSGYYSPDSGETVKSATENQAYWNFMIGDMGGYGLDPRKDTGSTAGGNVMHRKYDPGVRLPDYWYWWSQQEGPRGVGFSNRIAGLFQLQKTGEVKFNWNGFRDAEWDKRSYDAKMYFEDEDNPPPYVIHYPTIDELQPWYDWPAGGWGQEDDPEFLHEIAIGDNDSQTWEDNKTWDPDSFPFNIYFQMRGYEPWHVLHPWSGWLPEGLPEGKKHRRYYVDIVTIWERGNYQYGNPG